MNAAGTDKENEVTSHEPLIMGGTVNNMKRWLLRQDAASVFYVVIATVLLAWLVWTFFE